MDASTLIIIPCYNERENIAKLITSIADLYSEMHILVVDDNSPDGTQEVVKELQTTYPETLQLIVREGKGGRGSAVLAGFTYAKDRHYEVVFEMDADCSHDPKEIPRFLEKVPEYDVVIGSRYIPGGDIIGWNWQRKWISYIANTLERLILRMPIQDYTNGYRCYSRRAIETLELERINAQGYIVLSEICYQLYCKGLKVTGVPSVFTNRQHGRSNLSLGEIVEALTSIVRLRLSYSRLKK